ncbi:hypothetical protein [Pleomorphochaeta sp. DL1XJH-081]|uniref:hypothetical protein n=1 Tax=Pleomorphochaeta sp. DL1XJH-081 TaxID=3409690 RepID=UPI003BB5E9C0
MKKTLVLFIAILFVGGVLFAELTGTTGDTDTGSLVVYGEIPPGAIEFTVTQTDSSNVDLLSAIVAPAGAGYVIGNWDLTSTNQAANAYTITYDYGTLDLNTTSIEYVLLEYAAGATTGGAQKSDLATTGITTTAGTTTVGRNIGFRLTNTGLTTAIGAPEGSYQDTVTITIETN